MCRGSHALGTAIGNGNLEMVKWLHAHRATASTLSIDVAASHNHIGVVQWLHENLDAEWLHKNRQEGCSTKAMDRAAQNDKFEMVKWLHENRTEGCTSEAMDSSAANGNLEDVQFLHTPRQEGCTAKAFDSAAKHGHLRILKWLCANLPQGCTGFTLRSAALSEKLQVVQFLTLYEHIFLESKELEEIAANGHFAVVEWLLEHYQTLGKLDEGNPFVKA